MTKKRKISLAVLIVAVITLTVFLMPQIMFPPSEVYAKKLPGPFSKPSAVAIGDYNGDGLNEIAVANTGNTGWADDVNVYKSDGETLIKTWHGFNDPNGVAIGDYDNDGVNDIAIVHAHNLTVYRVGTGETIQYTYLDGSPRGGLSIGDYNGDGLNEIAYGDIGGGNKIWIKSMSGYQRMYYTGPPAAVAIGDFNNDGSNELASSETIFNDLQYISKVIVRRNDAPEGAQLGNSVIWEQQWAGSAADVWGLAIGDYDNDGFNDLAITRSYNPGNVTIYRGGGTSKIAALTGLDTPRGVAIGDLNNDGLNDMAVAEYGADAVWVYYQTKPGTVKATELAPKVWIGLQYPLGLAIGDFDGNGLNELAFAEAGSARSRVVLYKSDGVTVLRQWEAAEPMDVAIGDLDNDGLNDLAVVEREPNYYVNVHWGNGTQTYPFISGLYSPGAADIGDYDNDGLNELAYSDLDPVTLTDTLTVVKSDPGRTVVGQWTGLDWTVLPV